MIDVNEVVPDGTKTIVDVGSLDDLGTRKVVIEIERGDQVYRFPAQLLSWSEWRQVERDIPKPEPPSRGSPKGIIYQRDDPKYLEELEEANYRVGLARLVKFLQIPIAGATLNEQIDTLQNKLDRGIIISLLTVMGREHNLSEARIMNRASGF